MKRAQVKHKDPFHHQFLAAAYTKDGMDQHEMAMQLGIAYFNVNRRAKRSVTRINRYEEFLRTEVRDGVIRYYRTRRGMSPTQARARLRELEDRS